MGYHLYLYLPDTMGPFWNIIARYTVYWVWRMGSITICKETTMDWSWLMVFLTLYTSFFLFLQNRYMMKIRKYLTIIAFPSYSSWKKYQRSVKTWGNEKSMINGHRSSILCILLLGKNILKEYLSCLKYSTQRFFVLLAKYF